VISLRVSAASALAAGRVGMLPFAVPVVPVAAVPKSIDARAAALSFHVFVADFIVLIPFIR
jgi:hypothetical protein